MPYWFSVAVQTKVVTMGAPFKLDTFSMSMSWFFSGLEGVSMEGFFVLKAILFVLKTAQSAAAAPLAEIRDHLDNDTTRSVEKYACTVRNMSQDSDHSASSVCLSRANRPSLSVSYFQRWVGGSFLNFSMSIRSGLWRVENNQNLTPAVCRPSLLSFSSSFWSEAVVPVREWFLCCTSIGHDYTRI